MKEISFMSKAEVYNLIELSQIKDIENIDTIKYTITEYCKDSLDITACENIKAQLLEKGLFEFEIYQLLDNPPKTLLCLQLVVEEMEERYTEEELNNILSLFL